MKCQFLVLSRQTWQPARPPAAVAHLLRGRAGLLVSPLLSRALLRVAPSLTSGINRTAASRSLSHPNHLRPRSEVKIAALRLPPVESLPGDWLITHLRLKSFSL